LECGSLLPLLNGYLLQQSGSKLPHSKNRGGTFYDDSGTTWFKLLATVC
jgi:hypothetical protein